MDIEQKVKELEEKINMLDSTNYVAGLCREMCERVSSDARCANGILNHRYNDIEAINKTLWKMLIFVSAVAFCSIGLVLFK